MRSPSDEAPHMLESLGFCVYRHKMSHASQGRDQSSRSRSISEQPVLVQDAGQARQRSPPRRTGARRRDFHAAAGEVAPSRIARCTRYSPIGATAGAVAGLENQAAPAATPAMAMRPLVSAHSAAAKPSTAGVWVHIARLAVDHTDVASP